MTWDYASNNIDFNRRIRMSYAAQSTGLSGAVPQAQGEGRLQVSAREQANLLTEMNGRLERLLNRIRQVAVPPVEVPGKGCIDPHTLENSLARIGAAIVLAHDMLADIETHL